MGLTESGELFIVLLFYRWFERIGFPVTQILQSIFNPKSLRRRSNEGKSQTVLRSLALRVDEATMFI